MTRKGFLFHVILNLTLYLLALCSASPVNIPGITIYYMYYGKDQVTEYSKLKDFPILVFIIINNQ